MSNVVFGDPAPNYYNTALAQLISTYTDLVNKVQIQNNNIDKQTQILSQDHSADYKKSFYQNQSIEYLKSIYIYLFYIYYFLIFIIIFIFVMNMQVYNSLQYYLIILFLFLFPFIIYPIEQFIYSVFIYIYNFMTEQVFSNVYMNTNY